MSREASPRSLARYYTLDNPLVERAEFNLDFRPSPGGFGQHLRHSWGVLVRYRGMIAGIVLVVLFAVGIATFMMEPQFTASVTLQIDPTGPKVAPVQEVQQAESERWDHSEYYETQYKILASPSIAARTIQGLHLDDHSGFTDDSKFAFLAALFQRLKSFLPKSEGIPEVSPTENGLPRALIDRYLDKLQVRPVWKSRLVTVSFTSRDPALSAEVANRHTQEFVDASLERRLSTTIRAKEFLEQEIDKSRERVVGAEAALNAYRRKHQIVSVESDQGDIVSERLADLNRRFTEAQAARIDLESKFRLVGRRDYEGLPEVVGSQLVQLLKQRVAEAEQQRAELGKKFGRAYPAMAEAVAREAQVNERLQAEIRKIVDSIESAYLAAATREKEIGAQLEAQRQIALEQKDIGSEYGTLKRDMETTRDLYSNLLQRLKDVDVAEEIKMSNVSVIDSAAMPAEPSSPNWGINLGLALFAGLFGSLALAFLRDHLDDTLKAPEQAEERLGVAVLGMVPSFAENRNGYGDGDGKVPAHPPAAAAGWRLISENGGAEQSSRASNDLRGELVLSKRPQSAIAEAYRTIQTGILLSSAERPPRVILFTSSLEAEGKTVTAVNMAIAFAGSGARVLLIDADIRKPRIHELFGIPDGLGLSNYLTGQVSLDSVLHEVAPDGQGADGNGRGLSAGRLCVLPTGPRAPNPAELLGSQAMSELLGVLRERFEFIIVDSPPVLPVTDAVRLAALSDGVVLVVRADETPAGAAVRSFDRLDRAQAKILGLVLNDGSLDRGHPYYSYSYSYS